MWNLILSIIDHFVVNPLRGLLYTFTGTVVGYTPNIITDVSGVGRNAFDMGFQYCVWGLTSVVAIFAIVAAIQKQMDRRKKKKQERETKDLF